MGLGWVQVPLWLLAGFESQHEGLCPSLGSGWVRVKSVVGFRGRHRGLWERHPARRRRTQQPDHGCQGSGDSENSILGEAGPGRPLPEAAAEERRVANDTGKVCPCAQPPGLSRRHRALEAYTMEMSPLLDWRLEVQDGRAARVSAGQCLPRPVRTLPASLLGL